MQFWVSLSLSTMISSNINTAKQRNVCLSLRDRLHQQFQKKWIICLNYPGFLSGMELRGLLQLRLIPSCGWIRVAVISSPGGWIQVTTKSRFGGWIRVTAESMLRLTRVPAAGYGLRPTPYHGWLEFRQLDTSYSWLHPTADSNSGGWIGLKADSILWLKTSYGWFYSTADSSPSAGLDLRLTYTLIYQVILRTYSAKYLIFMVCFLPTDFSYHWSRLWLLLQEPWRSLRKLEEASRP